MALSNKYFFFRKDSKTLHNSNRNCLNALNTFNFYILKNNGQIIDKRSNILDLGCGDGSFVKFLNKLNISITKNPQKFLSEGC